MNSGTITNTLVFQENALNNSQRVIQLFLPLLFCTSLLVACSSGKDAASQAIEAYIRALGNQDATQLSNLSCASWEAQAKLEMDSLAGVGSKVEDLACQQAGQDGNDTLVSCTGKLALDYNGEAQQIDLASRTYIARQEGGEWRMCGYH